MGKSKYHKLLKSNKYFIKYNYSLVNLSSANNGPNYDYNYLQKSLIPTMHFQKSLQRLPIPKLEDSCQRYLNALKPIVENKDDLNRTTDLVNKFKANEGKLLDEELRKNDAANKESSYISEPWFDMYLSDRQSIVLNYNPFIAFVPHSKPDLMTQSVRATNYLISSLRFMKSIRENLLEPEVFHLNPEKSDTLLFRRLMRLLPESVSFYGAYMFNAYPLDMSQYFRLFNSTRIPKKGKDVLLTDPNHKHIVVLRKGHFFVFPVLDNSGNILPSSQILSCMNHITEMNLENNENSIGVLTSENRDVWASLREKLESLGNKEALNKIDTALYCICLDDVSTDDVDQLSHTFLHGEPTNRWFDKSFSMIVTKNSHVAINFEHSWGDGVAILRLFTELFKDVDVYRHVTTGTNIKNTSPKDSVQKLEFNLDPSITNAINEAKQKYKVSTGKLKLTNFNFDDFGKKHIKKFGISPDSFMQSAFQAAYYKMYGKTVATYESCSTAAFKYGRTETIRSATIHTQALSKLLAQSDDKIKSSREEIIKTLSECSKLHNQLTKEAAMGQGFDRHLFAMRYLAQSKGQQLPEIYTDKNYQLINHNILSTSTLAHETILVGGFAPVVPNGYGIGYRILDDHGGACISSYDQDLSGFRQAVFESLNKIYSILKDQKKNKEKD